MANTAGRGKTSIFILYFCIVLCIAAGVALFAVLYQGDGASALRNASNEFDDALESAQAMDIEAPAAPTPAPREVSVEGRVIPYRSEGKWGYKNTLGQVVIPPAFSDAMEFAGGLAFAAQDSLYGLLSLNNIWIVEPVWTAVSPFSEGYAAVEKDGKWGYIDTTGNLAIDYQFREAGSFHCGRAAARSASSYGYIDILGKTAVHARWRQAGDFSEDLAFAISDEYEKDRQFIIDKVGEKVATLGSTLRGTTFSEGFAAVSDDGVWYYLNATGRSAFRQTFLEAKAFSEGLAAVKTAEGWGYINDLGSFAIPAVYQDADSFSEGLAAVQDAASGKWGYVDAKGEMRIEPAYDSAEPFADGFALACVDTAYYLLDPAGTAKLFYTAD